MLRGVFRRTRTKSSSKESSSRTQPGDAVANLLKSHIATSGLRVRELFKLMDPDEEGTICKKHLQTTVRRLSDPKQIPNKEVDAFFKVADVHRNGTIEFEVLSHLLRLGQDERLDKKLQPGACGEIETTRHNRIELRSAYDGDLRYGVSPALTARRLAQSRNLAITEPDKSILFQLFEAVRERKWRVYDLFKDWDTNRVGKLDYAQFRAAMQSMGFRGSEEAIVEAFEEIDADRSGFIELRALQAAVMLRHFDMTPRTPCKKRRPSESEKRKPSFGEQRRPSFSPNLVSSMRSQVAVSVPTSPVASRCSSPLPMRSMTPMPVRGRRAAFNVRQLGAYNESFISGTGAESPALLRSGFSKEKRSNSMPRQPRRHSLPAQFSMPSDMRNVVEQPEHVRPVPMQIDALGVLARSDALFGGPLCV